MSNSEPSKVNGMDVPIIKLTPLREREVSKKNFGKLVANLKAVGLIEPLCICNEGEQYYILDGYLRYKALLDMGVESVPCLVLPSRDLYTPNRQVNHLSPKQEVQMLRNALEKLDESIIAKAFGVDSLNIRLNTSLYRSLHPSVIAELDSGKLMQTAAKELMYVVLDRQQEILNMMQESGDWSVAFAKAQVLRTPPGQRNKQKRHKNPWAKGKNTKRVLARKLAEVEKHYDFYSDLYRQYVSDLLKLAIYIRKIIINPDLKKCLTEKYPDDLKFFASVLDESEGKLTG